MSIHIIIYILGVGGSEEPILNMSIPEDTEHDDTADSSQGDVFPADRQAYVEAKAQLAATFDRWFTISAAGRRTMEGRFMGAFRQYLSAPETKRRTTVFFKSTNKRPLPRQSKQAKKRKVSTAVLHPTTLASEMRNPGSFVPLQVTAAEGTPEWARQMFERNMSDLAKLKVDVLKKMCKLAGLLIGGTKTVLIGRLNSFFNSAN